MLQKIYYNLEGKVNNMWEVQAVEFNHFQENEYPKLYDIVYIVPFGKCEVVGLSTVRNSEYYVAKVLDKDMIEWLKSSGYSDNGLIPAKRTVYNGKKFKVDILLYETKTVSQFVDPAID